MDDKLIENERAITKALVVQKLDILATSELIRRGTKSRYDYEDVVACEIISVVRKAVVEEIKRQLEVFDAGDGYPLLDMVYGKEWNTFWERIQNER